MSWRDRPYAREDYGGGGRKLRLGLGGMAPVVKWLIIANVAVAVLGIALQIGKYTIHGQLPLYYLGELHWQRTVAGVQLWRVVTYQYLHGGLFHLLFNMLVLWFAGSLIERQLGGRTFLVFYTFCGVVAGLAFLALVPAVDVGGRSGYILIGASGSVLGVLTAAAIFFPNQIVYLFFVLRMRMRTLVLGLAAVYLLTVIAKGDLSDAAHLGGMVGGWVWIQIARRRAGRHGAPGVVARSAGRWQRKQHKLRKEQAKVDRILAKVHDRGVGSLSWWEKRALRKATERQRQREEELDRHFRER